MKVGDLVARKWGEGQRPNRDSTLPPRHYYGPERGLDIAMRMKVGDLLRKRSTGQVCVLVDFAPAQFGEAWLKVMIDGEIRKKWSAAGDYEKVN